MTSYVHDGTEVKLTGREAVKKVATIPNKPPREIKIVEITPIDPTFDWKKWVPLEQLYKVIENKE